MVKISFLENYGYYKDFFFSFDVLCNLFLKFQ